MEYIIELILELFLDGSIVASKNKKVPKPIRYAIILLLVLFFLTVIFLVIFTGFLILKISIIAGIILIGIGIFMFINAIIKFRKSYLIKK